MNKKLKKRLVGIDFCRLFAVLCIFCFHCFIHMNIKFSFLGSFFSQGAVVMVLFFMISGFSLQYVHNNADYTDWSNVKKFYIRHLSGIYPLYLVIMIIDGFLYMRGNIMQLIMLLPVETLGLQGYFDTLYGFWNNGGTWFISCIILCYIAFPFLCFILKNIGRKSKIIIGIIIYLIDSASPVIASVMGCTWVYPKPFFRLLQFILGMLIASLCFSVEGESGKGVLSDSADRDVQVNKYVKFGMGGGIILMFILAVTFLHNRDWGTYGSYNFIAVPVFALLLYLSRDLNLKENKLTGFLVKISFAVYLVQGYSFRIVNKIFGVTENPVTNVIKFFAALGITIILGAVAHYCVEKPAKNILLKKLDK